MEKETEKKYSFQTGILYNKYVMM